MPAAELSEAWPSADPQTVAAAARLLARWPALRPFATIGAGSVVVGGVVAAVSRPTGFELGSWLAAFLVLVGGVAQVALGAGQAWLVPDRLGPAVIRAEVLAWNVGVVATVVGSLASAPVVSTVGATATSAALVVFLRTAGGGRARRGRRDRLLLALYRAVLLVVLVSTPIGLALAWTRHG